MSLLSRVFWVLTAALAVLALPSPATAAEVLLFDGHRLTRTDDPFMPSRAEGDLPRPRGGATAVTSATSRRGRRAVGRALRGARRARRISLSRYGAYGADYRGALRTLRRLRGSRRAQLGYVIGVAERLALRDRLSSSRMPAVFLILRRNRSFFGRRGPPGANSKLRFRGSEVTFQYYSGRGLQLQPLVNFKRANALWGACFDDRASCSRSRLTKLLDELNATASRRSRRFVAWEYYFGFGGGSPPWMSGMAQATAIQALGRSSRLLGRPDLAARAREALGAFETGPPTGVRVRGFRGGPHYLQYSFARRLFIMNAFLQSIIGLYDFEKATGDDRAGALWRAAEPEALSEIPSHDIGDWSRYSFRGRESTRDYHELLREFLTSLCNRRRIDLYCDRARRFRSYQTDPTSLRFDGPRAAARNRLQLIRFGIAKKSAVEVRVTREGRTGMHTVATFRRGQGRFRWRPRSTGTYVIRLGAKELRTGRGLRTRTQAEVEVTP